MRQDPLPPDLAQLSAVRGQWRDAARQWHTAVQGVDALTEGATENLSHAPAGQREPVRTLLLKTLGDAPARRMDADLELTWGRPVQAWALLEANLPQDPALSAQALQRFPHPP